MAPIDLDEEPEQSIVEKHTEFQSDLIEDIQMYDESTLEVWELWEHSSDKNETELRSDAVQEMKKCNNSLKLTYLNLSTLPNIFLYGLRELNIEGNELSQIPENLPETLEILNIQSNKLNTLPKKLPSCLCILHVSYNELISLPETLPDSLEELYASENSIVTLPNRLPESLQKLRAHTNKLTAISEIIPDLIDLDVSYNQISIFPVTLPTTLEDLSVDNNNITSLPEHLNLPSLKYFHISENKLTTLPDNLPQSLETLNVSGNKLTVISESLPKSLKYLHLDSNNLSYLPEVLPPRLELLFLNNNQFTEFPSQLLSSTTLSTISLVNNQITEVTSSIERIPNATIDFDENPLSETSMEYVRNLLRTTNRPNVYFEGRMEYYINNIETKPLVEEIINWVGTARLVDSYWNTIITEEEMGRRQFSRLLYRLRNTINYENEEFKEEISNWLCELGEENDIKKALREKIYLIAEEANESCDHRVGWSLNQMKILSVAIDVEFGKYDNKISELIQLGRGMFRLHLLDQISRNTVDNLMDYDEIEIYLEYQIRLRDILKLPVEICKMNAGFIFVLTEENIEKAIVEIETREKLEFLDYLLTDWQPWKEVLKRWNEENYIKSANSIKNEELFQQKFDQRKNEYMNETNLSELSSDTEIQLGKQVQRSIERDIWFKLTKEFLKCLELDLETLI